jgi:hypothetical protein
MRSLIAALLVVCAMAPALAVPRAPDIDSNTAGLRWINKYRQHPDPMQVPAAMKALSRIGVFGDTEHIGAYVGFLAGVIGSNPRDADKIVAQTLEMQQQDRWVVVRAIAFSELPEWKSLLREYAGRVPYRRVMIEKYLTGQLPNLDRFEVTPSQSGFEKFRDRFKIGQSDAPKPLPKLEPGADVLDILWGYYFATGSYGPVIHIIDMLAWASDHNDVERLNVGSMAKFTLASNASHDPELREMLRSSMKARNQPKKTVAELKEIVEAAETMEIAKIRKQALESIADLQRKGPAYKRDVSWWGYIGQSSIAAGCLAAAVASVTAAGLPCVIGGATASAAMNFWANQP